MEQFFFQKKENAVIQNKGPVLTIVLMQTIMQK